MSIVVEKFLDTLAGVLSLPALRLDEDSVCCLYTPGEIEIQMEWVAEGGRLMVLSPVGTLGSDPAHARGLLWANFLFGGTRGESLALEPEGDRVFLCREIELEVLSMEQAIERFEAFVDTARHWQHRLAEPGSDAPLQALTPKPMLRV